MTDFTEDGFDNRSVSAESASSSEQETKDGIVLPIYPSFQEENTNNGSRIIYPYEINDSQAHLLSLEGLPCSENYSDVTLLVGNRTFSAHKVFLGLKSDVFQTMLTSKKWKDSEKTEVTLYETAECEQVFHLFLKYFYTTKLTLCLDNVKALHILADKYNVMEMQKQCTQYMIEHIPVECCINKTVEWLEYAQSCQHSELENKCMHFISSNVDIVVSSSAWLQLGKENMKSVLSNSDLILKNEYVLLQALLRWIDHKDFDEREALFAQYISLIRFPLILPKHLLEFEREFMNFDGITQDNSGLIQQEIIKAYRHHAIPFSERPSFYCCNSSDYAPRIYTHSQFCHEFKIDFRIVKKGHRVSCEFKTGLSSSYADRNHFLWKAVFECRNPPDSHGRHFRALSRNNLTEKDTNSQSYSFRLKLQNSTTDGATCFVDLSIRRQQNNVSFINPNLNICKHFSATDCEIVLDKFIDKDELFWSENAFSGFGIVKNCVTIYISIRPVI